MKLNPLTQIDFYKTGHIFQYPPNTTLVYSNFTPRTAKRANVLAKYYDNKIVWFGLQGFIKWFLMDLFNNEFFSQPKEKVVAYYKRRMDTSLGKDSVDVSHIAALHDLGYLPIKIKALPEGSKVNIGVLVFTIQNTLPEFFWLTNYLETVLSSALWKSSTNATVAYQYRKIFEYWAEQTGGDFNFIPFQGHDFSFRGMSGPHDAAMTGSAHLLSFFGTDTIPAIDYLEDYYNANAETELIGTSVPATEHSVMSMGTKENELETYRRLITKTYPTGIVSIVSDTWDFWKVITEYTRTLKQEILERKPNEIGLAKVVFRPDSGNPVDIICGVPTQTINGNLYKKHLSGELESAVTAAEAKGAVECLWDIFGGTINKAGYKVLHERVGLIYGDSITLARAEEILKRLEEKGFASTNVVFGIGSYTYQYSTRDSFGFAMKATYGEVDGKAVEIFKDPVTDDGTKKSAKGLLAVHRWEDDFILQDQATKNQEALSLLTTVFENGKLVREDSLAAIRERLLK